MTVHRHTWIRVHRRARDRWTGVARRLLCEACGESMTEPGWPRLAAVILLVVAGIWLTSHAEASPGWMPLRSIF